MSETATATARKTYTRRTTRDRVVDLLEEAIRLVKARCVEPEKGSSTTKAARDMLAESKREFAEAVEMKRQANAALETATAVVSSASEQEAEGGEEAPVVIPPLPMTLKKKTKTASAALAATGGAGATAAPAALAATVPTGTATARNTTVKVKKAPSCPGGPKAFNEFLKSKRAEVEAELGDQAPYSEVRARIAQLWKETCSSVGGAGGGAATKRTTRKLKTPATPGRVNAPVSLAASETQEETVQAPEAPGSALSVIPEVSASKETEAEAEEEEQQQNENSILPVQAYEDLGMDDMFGMRKVRVDGRDLYMTDANKGLFNRNDEDDDPLGEFVGYLRNGKIVEQNAPNS